METYEPTEQRVKWQSLSAIEVAERLGTDPEAGLSDSEAKRRLSLYGPNRLREEKKRPAVFRFLSQFNNFIIWVLLAAAAISGILLSELVDAAVILAIVVMNAILGFAQESRSEKAMLELKKLSAPNAKVIRNGGEAIVPVWELVPGDLIVLEAGNLVGADARLASALNLRVDESNLTGESAAVEKRAGDTVSTEASVGDRLNMVFAGTHIEYGRGTATVVETGNNTEIGQIATMLEESGPGVTPLQIELHKVGRAIVYICIAVALVVFAVGMTRGISFSLMLLFAVSLAVAAIPEGLPAIVTITLAVGMQAMSRQNAIVRNLPAVETLGCADYICSDKTGTLTVNRMTVTDVLFADGEHRLLPAAAAEDAGFRADALKRMFMTAVLCNDARKAMEGGFIGEATEVSLLEAGVGIGIDKAALDREFPRVAEVPFDSDRKMMTTANRSGEGFVINSKGATEEVLNRCESLMTPRGIVLIDAAARRVLLERTTTLASLGLRTLALAFREVDSLPDVPSVESLERGLVFAGTFAMKDPPRPEAFDALKTCREASVEVAMITGDHQATAEAVARDLEILTPGRRVVDGQALEKMDMEELVSQVEGISVYARVSPRHKVKIVEALKARGHVVAMTGDGVNDAPALKCADIGVAMGETGTDVAKEASDMVLTDDNFATIVAAVRRGRIIFSNIQKFIYFLLSANICIVLALLAAMLSGFPLPLLPSQVLWINLVTNGLPALALGLEVPERSIMERPPRSRGESILSLKRQRRLLWQGVVLSAGALAAFTLSHYILGYPWDTAAGLDMNRTVLFTTMVLACVLHAYNWRSETRSLFASPPWENRYLLGSLFLSVGLQLSVLYLPFMQKAFKTSGPTGEAWLLILLCAVVPVLIIDRLKVLTAKRSRPQERP